MIGSRGATPCSRYFYLSRIHTHTYIHIFMQNKEILVSTFKGKLAQVGVLDNDVYRRISGEPGRNGITGGETPEGKPDVDLESCFAWVAIPEYNYRSLRSQDAAGDADKWYMTLPMVCYGAAPLRLPEATAYREAYLGGVAKIAMDLMRRQNNFVAGAYPADLEIPSLYMARITVQRRQDTEVHVVEEDRTYHRLNEQALVDQLGLMVEIPVYLTGLQVGAAMAYIFSDMPENLEGAELFNKTICQKYTMLTLQEAYDKMEVWREQHPDLKALHETGDYFL